MEQKSGRTEGSRLFITHPLVVAGCGDALRRQR